MSKRNQLVALMGALGTATIIAACGGGGGGGGTLPPPNPSPSPSLLPSPAASPQLSGSLQVASGAIPAHNLALSTPSDVYSAAAALYVYANSPSGVTAFDEWNFNAVAAWLTQLHNAPNAQEMKLLNDIAAQSAAHNTLFPAAPSWNPAQPVNATIAGDLVAVKSSADAIKPTPCPSGACTGTPSP